MNCLDARWVLLFIGRFMAVAATVAFLGCMWLYLTGKDKGDLQ